VDQSSAVLMHLRSRAVLRVSGSEAEDYLHRVTTQSMIARKAGEGRYSALLTPQGKIIADFLALKSADGTLYLDVPREQAQALLSRLAMFKLRADVRIEDVTSTMAVVWSPHTNASSAPGRDVIASAVDPRDVQLGHRAIIPQSEAQTLAQGDAAHIEACIKAGVPTGGIDFAYMDAFPHEANMDQLHGLDFKKGCYIGQEIVSRMEHRGTARKRIIPLTWEGETAPQTGDALKTVERALGTVGAVSKSQRRALAMVRLDKLDDALKSGQTISASDLPMRPHIPAWAAPHEQNLS
jgi:tRNA-modifying protein YgfZ